MKFKGSYYEFNTWCDAMRHNCRTAITSRGGRLYALHLEHYRRRPFRCMRMLCDILRLHIPQLGDSSTAAMSLVIVEIFRAVPHPSSARSAAAQTGLLTTPR